VTIRKYRNNTFARSVTTDVYTSSRQRHKTARTKEGHKGKKNYFECDFATVRKL